MTDDPPPSFRDELRGFVKLIAWILGIGLVFVMLTLIGLSVFLRDLHRHPFDK